MNRTTVSSSVIATIGYDAASNVLEVEFRTGRVYQYFMVPRSAYESLLTAKSVGRYFNTRIRDRYENREIENG